MMHGTGTTHGTPRDTLADLDDALWTLYASGARDPGDNPSAVRRLEACRAAGVDARRVLSYVSQTDETFCARTGIAPDVLVSV